MSTGDDRAAWVARVLGIDLPRSAPAGRIRVLPIWQQAKEAADVEIERLQAGFRATGHPLGRIISDQGLTGFSRRLFVPMVVALMEYDAAADPTAVTAKALSALGGVQDFVARHPAIAVLERNPFGVSVTLRATLGAAVNRIAAAIGRA